MKIEVVLSAVGLEPNDVETWLAANMPWICEHRACVITDMDLPAEHLYRTLRIPEQERYDIGRINNRGIRSSTAEIIVKSDVDVAIGYEAMQYCCDVVRPGRALIQKCNNVELWHIPGIAREGHEASWDPRRVRPAGRGAFFAMHRDDWLSLRGYDERMRGYAGDDDDLFRRAGSMLDVEQSARYPVWHAIHPQRISARFPNCREHNLFIMNNLAPWHETPESENWGSEHDPV